MMLGLMLALCGISIANAAETTYHLQKLETPRDVLAVNENFRSLSGGLSKLDDDLQSQVAALSSQVTGGYVNTSDNFTMSGELYGMARSSFTYIPPGNTTAGAFSVAYATVAITISGNFDLLVTLNCSGTPNANGASINGSFMYDGDINKFGLSSTVGAWAAAGTSGGALNLSGSFPISRHEIVAGSHTFGVMFAAYTGGYQMIWPPSTSPTTSCRFGVMEVH